MTTRTLRQLGLGYAAEPLTIVAKINGVVAYEGPLTTVDEPVPTGPETPADWEKNVPLFTWTNTVDFEGTAEVEVAVSGNGTLIIATTVANYTAKFATSPEGKKILVSSGPDEYIAFVTSPDDPYVNPKIDGITVERTRGVNPEKPLFGQWFYQVNSGSVFTGTLNIQKGLEPQTVEE